MSAAQASVTVEVWGGYGYMPLSVTPDQAEQPVPTQASTAEFTWTGPIDWVNNNGNNGTDSTQNLFSQFLTGGTISDYSSGLGVSETDFLNTSMSSEGNAWYTYIQVTGYTNAGFATIGHDDGASVYQGGSAIYSSPGQTSIDYGTFAVTKGAYTIDYIEANGSPSDLVFNVVPEPSTWVMMLAGFAGLGFTAFRRSRKDTLSIA